MARHRIPERVVSDNGPQYNSDEFRIFATKYEFEHVTSSPGYPQSNGKAESAVKMAKCIMEKAAVPKQYPYLALLEHMNTLSDGMSTFPAQRLFGRRTRTRLPTSTRLLKPIMETKSTKEELEKAKSKQALHYDRGAKVFKAKCWRYIVRMIPKKGTKTWANAKVTIEVSPKSYIVTAGDGARYGRNRRHPKKTLEPDMEETNIELPLRV
ncbi:Retrovirus-related Pol poly from transposon [Paramuricea clavata]|uniref:Retrovirus-related Pol poly from transposon n=1 Tax=Paramuricea clavata TaxID=317549 RepID=A0A6S7G7B5_PARCT|nr:Retrovirus-related Pol poly from transposon [Paramuricea clavata]